MCCCGGFVKDFFRDPVLKPAAFIYLEPPDERLRCEKAYPNFKTSSAQDPSADNYGGTQNIRQTTVI